MNHIFDWLFGQYQGVSAVFVALELVAVFFGIASVYYSSKRHILVYPTGILSTAIYVYLCAVSVLYGDMLINFYYTAMSIYGWLLWKKNSTDGVHVRISKMNFADVRKSLALALMSVILVAVVYYFKPLISQAYKDAPLGQYSWLDITDIFTTAVFLVGMWLMAQRKIENWLCWIVGDVVSVPLYFYKGMTFTSVQYFIFTILAILAYFKWRDQLYKEQAQ